MIRPSWCCLVCFFVVSALLLSRVHSQLMMRICCVHSMDNAGYDDRLCSIVSRVRCRVWPECCSFCEAAALGRLCRLHWCWHCYRFLELVLSLHHSTSSVLMCRLLFLIRASLAMAASMLFPCHVFGIDVLSPLVVLHLSRLECSIDSGQHAHLHDCSHVQVCLQQIHG
jgi:hypothetical protein